MAIRQHHLLDRLSNDGLRRAGAQDVGRWSRDAFDELGGHPLVGRTIMLEIFDERIVAMWSPNGSSFVTVPEKRAAPAVDDGLVAAAVEHVNRKRNGIQPPLERRGCGWVDIEGVAGRAVDG